MADDTSSNSLATNQSEVEYRDVPRWPGHRVGTDGSVWSCWYHAAKGGRMCIVPNAWRQRFGHHRADGYTIYTFERGAKKERFKIHCLLLEAFVGPRPPGADGCHNDGNPLNNALPNLRWDTRAANMRDKVLHGRSARGTKNPKAKLTNNDVLEIRRLGKSGMSSGEIAKRFPIKAEHARSIILRKKWAWLEDE